MARKVYVGVEPEIKQLSEMTIGNSVKLNVDGSPTEFLVVHQGLPSSAYDTSCDGIWLVMKDCYELMKWHTSTTNSYGASSVHTYLNGTFLNKLDAGVKSLVKQVKIPYVNGTGSSGSVVSGSSGLSTKVFLLSAKEVGTSHSAASTEGAKLSYFTSNSRRIAKLNGTAQHYWLRSVRINNTTEACCIYDTGELNPTDQVTNTYAAIRPALILPLETTIVDGVITGVQELKSVARKVKQMYVGVESKAKRVKKAYIGIGGVARPFWGDYELAYYGTATALSYSDYFTSAETVGDYALFAGGHKYSTSTVNAYNKSLSRTIPTGLSVGRGYIATATVGDYALFCGGRNSNGQSKDTVDAYNRSLTRSTPEVLPSNSTDWGYGFSGTQIGDYALIGRTGATVVYNTSLTRSTIDPLFWDGFSAASTTVGNYAIFTGGNESNSGSNLATAYNKSLTRTQPTSLSYRTFDHAATTVGNYAIFGGGYQYSSSDFYGLDTVNAYDQSLTRSIPTKLSVARGELTATTVNGYAIFAGGNSGSTYYANADTYDESLTKGTTTNLNYGRYGLASTTVGNYALFGGGYGGSYSNKVDAYVTI